MRPGARATAPCRVDLAGGTLDLWPLSQLLDDAVTINAAIDVSTSCAILPTARDWTFTSLDSGETATLEALPRRPERSVPPGLALAAVVASHFQLPPCRVETSSQAGRGSGLGGSSSLTVSLVAAASRLAGIEQPAPEALALACDLETRILELPAGSQDHWAAWYGGTSLLEYHPGGIRRTAIGGGARGLGRSLVLADTRVEHHSGLNNWAVFRAFLEKDSGTRAALEEVALASQDLRRALLSVAEGDELLAAAGDAVRAEWRARRRLSPAVTCPEVDRVVTAAERLGGAAKVCGAGGGGCVACFPATEGGRADLEAAISATGARVLRVQLVEAGVRCALLPLPGELP